MKKYLIAALLCLLPAVALASSFRATPQKAILYISPAVAGNTADTTEDTIQTYTMPAGTFNKNGQVIRITVTGSTAGNAHVKTLKIDFGSSVSTVFSTTSSGQAFWAQQTVMRTGSNAQYATLANELGGGVPGVSTSSPNQTDTAVIVIKTTAQTDTIVANDIMNVSMIVELLTP